jgi:hypothetical protein
MLIALFGPLLFLYDWHFFACAPHARELVKTFHVRTFSCVKSLDCLEFLRLAELLLWMYAPLRTHMVRGSQRLAQTLLCIIEIVGDVVSQRQSLSCNRV